MFVIKGKMPSSDSASARRTGSILQEMFIKPLRAAGVTVVSRLRKNAKLFTVPQPVKKRGPGQPRKYGTKRMYLTPHAAHRLGWETIECFVYGQWVTKTVKTFLATYEPARGVIRVVIVKETHGCEFFFCTDPEATPREIIETFGDRSSIEQDFHDVKEIWDAGQQ